MPGSPSQSAVSPTPTEPGHRTVRIVDVIAIAAATALSIGIQGFTVGVSNNAFHIPIVLGWPELPGFDVDPYYQTLNRFVSVVWPVLGWASTEEDVDRTLEAVLALAGAPSVPVGA